MLTENELEKLFDKHCLSAEARAVVKHIRVAGPSRRVGGGSGNAPSQYPSHKMRRVLQAESHTNELAALYIWDHDLNTYEIYDQPPQIILNYIDSTGRNRGHRATPDFFIIGEDFIGWVECKMDTWLQNQARDDSTLFVQLPDDTWQSPPGSEYAAQYGLGFAVRSSAENPITLVRNLRFLSDYWNEDKSNPPRYRPLESFYAELGNSAYCTLAELLRNCVNERVDEIYRAIVRGDIFVNLQEDALAEPELTRVFRSQSLAEVFSLKEKSKALDPQDDGLYVYPVLLEQGARIVWHDVPFVIMTVSEKRIFLKNPQNGPVTLSHEDFQCYVKSGEIRGLECSSETFSTVSDDLIAAASPRDLELATRRFRYLEQCQSASNGVAPPPLRSPRTIRYWKQLQREGMEKYGDGLLGLVSRISRRGPKDRILDIEIIQIMRDVINEHYMCPDPKSITVCYGAVRNKCEAAGFIPPCEKTFRKEIKITCDEHRRQKVQEGAGVAYKTSPFIYTLCATTPRHGDRPFEIGHIDSTEIDVQLVGSKHREHLGKAWLTLLLDAYSRAVLAFVILFDKPSYRSNMLVIRECIRRHSRVPAILVVDGGKEFQNKYFETLLAKLSSTKMTRPRKSPRTGGIIERFFHTANNAFFHNLRGNNKPLQNPREMSASHDPRKRAVWTLRDLTEAFARHVYLIYGNAEHGSLGVSPNSALANGLLATGDRPMRYISMTQGLAILCLPSTRAEQAKIIPSRGIMINKLHYFHPLMRDPKLAGVSVPVRYDPYDISKAYAYIEGNWVPCVSEYANALRGRSEKELAIVSRELNSLNRQRGDRRIVTAQAIARQFERVNVTEARLVQQKHDAEQQLAQSMTIDEEVQSDDTSAPPESRSRSADNNWDDVPVILLREFK